MFNRELSSVGWSIGLAILMTMSSPALAESGKGFAIEEIIVTAEKREAGVQDTPLAISTFSGEQLAELGIDDAGDLQYYVPGLTFGKTVTRTSQVTLRGIGAENINPGGDPGVAVHLDGAYQQSTAFIGQDFFDVERIEVLRGPQGTLYGRNATGGSINIITRRPTDQFEALLRVGLGNYDQRKVQGVISGPLTQSIRGRLAVDTEQRDGYTDNVFNGSKIDDQDYYAVRGKIDLDITDHLSLNLSVNSYRDDSTGVPLALVSPNPTAPLFTGLDLTTFEPVFSNPYADDDAQPNITLQNRRKVRHNTPTTGQENSDGFIAELIYDLGGFTLKSITGYTDMDFENAGDTDSSAEVTTRQSATGQYETLTQELLLTSQGGRPLAWTAGLYYYKEDSGRFFGIVLEDSTPLPTPFVGVPVTFDSGGDLEARSYAAFGQVTYALSDTWSLTGGVRYTRDEKEIDEFVLAAAFAIFDPATLGPVISNKDDDWSKTTGRIGVEYAPNDDVLVYGAVSTGFKAGGFNISGLQSSYDPETVTAYEAGVKTMLAEDRVRLNVAAFYYDYEDLQVFQIETVQAVITNAAKAEVSGVELEALALLSEALQLDASVSYLDATYEQFSSVDPVDPAGGFQDLSGNHLPRAPELSLNLGLSYTWNLGLGGAVRARANYSWIDDQYFRPFNLDRDRESSYSKTDLSVAWASADERWQAEGFVRNLEDEDTVSNMIIAAGSLGSTTLASFNPPRTFGLTLTARW